MVGLLYIHDPKCSPEQHSDEAQQLMDAFDGQYTMRVFKLEDKGGVQGDLLTVKDSSSSSSSGSSGSNAAAAGGSDGGSNGSNEPGKTEGQADADGGEKDKDKEERGESGK
jgi:hypothetical protein